MSSQVDLNIDASARELVPPAHLEHRIAEELRLIKRPLLLSAEQRRTDGQRQSRDDRERAARRRQDVLSLNLALSMASELDWNVLLVDADVKPRR